MRRLVFFALMVFIAVTAAFSDALQPTNTGQAWVIPGKVLDAVFILGKDDDRSSQLYLWPHISTGLGIYDYVRIPLESKAIPSSAVWSPNGRTLAFDTETAGKRKLVWLRGNGSRGYVIQELLQGAVSSKVWTHDSQ